MRYMLLVLGLAAGMVAGSYRQQQSDAAHQAQVAQLTADKRDLRAELKQVKHDLANCEVVQQIMVDTITASACAAEIKANTTAIINRVNHPGEEE